MASTALVGQAHQSTNRPSTCEVLRPVEPNGGPTGSTSIKALENSPAQADYSYTLDGQREAAVVVEEVRRCVPFVQTLGNSSTPAKTNRSRPGRLRRHAAVAVAVAVAVIVMTDVFGVYAASLASPALPRTGLFVIVIVIAFTRHDAPGVSDFANLSRLSNLPKLPKLLNLSSRLAGHRRGTAPSGVAAPSGAADRCTAAGWDQAAWDRLSCRLTILTLAFLSAVVPRAGRPVSTGTDEPDTQSFMAALEHAAGLLVGAALGDSPTELAAAVDEAERRWNLVQRSRMQRLNGNYRSDGNCPHPHIGCHPVDDDSL